MTEKICNKDTTLSFDAIGLNLQVQHFTLSLRKIIEKEQKFIPTVINNNYNQNKDLSLNVKEITRQLNKLAHNTPTLTELFFDETGNLSPLGTHITATVCSTFLISIILLLLCCKPCRQCTFDMIHCVYKAFTRRTTMRRRHRLPDVPFQDIEPTVPMLITR